MTWSSLSSGSGRRLTDEAGRVTGISGVMATFEPSRLGYVSGISTFPNTFAHVLDSNLHDLNETNTE